MNSPAADDSSTTGVLVVDVQGDFTTWKKGSLAVDGTGRSYVEQVEQATIVLAAKGYRIFGTQDWHPADHISFFTSHPGKNPFDTVTIETGTQILWPPHCVQGTENARVLIDNHLFLAIVKKGQDARYDSYSGFQDDGGSKTELNPILKKNGIRRLFVYGLATDYCVKATAFDALSAGYSVTVVESLCKGVGPDTTAEALKEMRSKGITVLDKIT